MIVFTDRAQAGRRLAEQLKAYANREDVTVLGVPRGGVPIAFQIAEELGVLLDIFVARKLGVPGQEELAFGAIASGGVCILDQEIIGAVGIPDKDIAEVAARERTELERRERIYRGNRAPLKISARIAILVDDGIATGSTTRAVISALRRLQPARLVVASPVAPLSTFARLRQEVDDLVCLDTPKSFRAISEFYKDFSPLTDQEVTQLLRQNWQDTAPRDM
jgi:putative phosphoribosyl transferase